MNTRTCLAQPLFENDEWQALYCYVNKTTDIPEQPPSLQESVRMVAKLGGFLGRKSDGDPGVTVLWRGLHRFNDITQSYRIFFANPKSQVKLMRKLNVPHFSLKSQTKLFIY